MSGRWDHLQYILCRGSPLAHPDFEPSSEVSTILALAVDEGSQWLIETYMIQAVVKCLNFVVTVIK